MEERNMLLRKKELLNVVEKALHATNTTSTQELHHCLRIRTDNNRLIAEGASPSVTITAIKECNESIEPLDIVVQAKMFKDIITKCKDDISLETTTKGSLKIKSGSMSFTTEYKSPSIWLVKPPFEEKESYQLDSDFFKETAHCLSKRDNDKMNCYCLRWVSLAIRLLHLMDIVFQYEPALLSQMRRLQLMSFRDHFFPLQ